MKKQSEKLFLIVLALPVIYALFMTAIGLVFGTKETVFKEAESAIQLPQRGQKPLIFSVPITYNNQAVYSYAIPKECYWEDGACHRTGYLKYSYDDVRDLVKLKVPGTKTQSQYLGTLNIYEKIALVEKFNDFIPWELWALLGGVIAFILIRSKKGIVTLFLWWWYAVWAIVGSLGFYAIWRTGFSNVQEHLENAFYLAIVTHHFESSSLFYLFLFLVLGVPVFFLLRFIFKKSKDGIIAAFNYMEYNWGCKDKNNFKKETAVKHINTEKEVEPCLRNLLN